MNAILPASILPLTSACAAGWPPYQNFLIVVPEADGGVSDEQVRTLAAHLNQSGFAYVARAGQKEMEDDAAGVRYLPLGQRLPFFGQMTAVIVIDHPGWAARAAEAYPDAQIFMLETAVSLVTSQISAWPALRAPAAVSRLPEAA